MHRLCLSSVKMKYFHLLKLKSNILVSLRNGWGGVVWVECTRVVQESHKTYGKRTREPNKIAGKSATTRRRKT